LQQFYLTIYFYKKLKTMNRKMKKLFFLALTCWVAGSAWALDKVGDVYQIGTADELIEFAGIVNGGENGAKAVLTSDIDMTGKAWTPIGNNDHRYIGTFDGQYHVIDNLVYEGGEKIGIFGVVSGGCVIKNLIAGSGNQIKGTSKIGGIVGCEDGSGWVTYENVGHEGYVYGTGNNCCAFIGVVMNGGPATRITNCFNTGNVRGGGESAIITGWFGGHGSVELKGFWNTGSMENGQDGSNSLWRNSTGITKERVFHLYADQDATVIGDGDLASGKLAYELNGNADAGVWKQNLSDPKDAHPTFIPSHANVYANGQLLCDGITAKEGSELTYSNTEGSTRDEHNFVDGICIVCSELYAVEGIYQLGCADALVRYSEIVRTTNGAASAVLTADIDMSGKDWTPIGQDAHDFKGHFNGQGHRILNLTTTANMNNQALFGQAVGGAIIENVVIDASCTIQGAAYTAGILGHVWGDGVIVRNCGNEAKINGSAQNSAGIVGCSEKIVYISNCYNSGEIVGSHESAGICAWMGSANSTLSNCYSTGTVNAGEGLYRLTSISATNNYQIEGKQGTAFTAEQLASGELAFLLNERVSGGETWYQVIHTDSHPVPFAIEGGKVYTQGSLTCNGTPKDDVTYVNVESEPVQDAHTFADGICSVCNDAYDSSYMSATDGYYVVNNGKQLRWTAFVSRDDAAVKVKLTNDIDMEGIAFEGFGSNNSDDKRFVGEIDGQRHKITNLAMDYDRNGVGLVNTATAGATIKNLTISSCEVKGQSAVAAFIGAARGTGDIYIENCGNEGAVTATGANAGGIIGCRYDNITAHLTNVYNVGTIRGGQAGESGSLSGWMTNAVLVNCYSIAGYPTAENTYGFQEGNQFARGNSINLTNCYDYGTGAWGQNNGTWAGPFENGAGKIAEVNETEMGRVFAGLYDGEGGNVWRMEFEGWPHPVLYEPAKMVLSENVPNRYVAQENVTLTLKRTTVPDTWNTFCAPFDLTADQVTELFGSDAKVAALTDAEGETLKFSTTTEGIEAGKPYLVKPSEAITEKEITVTLVATAPTPVEMGGYAFTGVYEPTQIADGDLIFTANNMVQPATAGQIKGFRAYLKPVSADGARITNFVIDETTTDIQTLDNLTISPIDNSVYDLQGRRLSNGKWSNGQMQKGLYIVNGKKHFVK